MMVDADGTTKKIARMHKNMNNLTLLIKLNRPFRWLFEPVATYPSFVRAEKVGYICTSFSGRIKVG